jgi:hypothetical protein
MTNFLQWRKMTWALLAWSAAMTGWVLIGSIAATRVGVLWVAGMIFLSLLWLATQPLFQQGRGLSGIFVTPRWGQLRLVNLHRTHRGLASGRGDVGDSLRG